MPMSPPSATKKTKAIPPHGGPAAVEPLLHDQSPEANWLSQAPASPMSDPYAIANSPSFLKGGGK